MRRCEQRVQVSDTVFACAWPGRGVAAAQWATHAGRVIAADASEAGQLVLQLIPVGGQAVLEHHSWVSLASATQEQPTPPDVEPAVVSAAGDQRRRRHVEGEGVDE